MVETQLWQRELAEGGSLPDVYTRSLVLVRLERQKLATQRSYYRALKEMQQIIKAEDAADSGINRSAYFSGEEEPAPEGGPGSPAGGDSKAPAPESGSFPPKDVAGEAPAPELGSFLPSDVAGEAPPARLGSLLARDVAGKGATCPGNGFVPAKRCRRRGAGDQIGFVSSTSSPASGPRLLPWFSRSGFACRRFARF
jgi:hypothetical protein